MFGAFCWGKGEEGGETCIGGGGGGGGQCEPRLTEDEEEVVILQFLYGMPTPSKECP